METTRPFCFVIMPFRPELNYLYLYLKRHIEDQHNIDCERGDAQILTKPLLEKIADYIRRADVLIADCTGRNPNVFYELGIAHANDKKVILISQDTVSEAPADIRHFEFIQYNLADHATFTAQIDNALSNVFSDRYTKLYEDALTLFSQFRKDSGSRVIQAQREVFVSRITNVERTRQASIEGDEYEKAEVLLPRIIADSGDVEVMTQITRWLSALAERTRTIPRAQSE
jgi:nucleoside 2-deoxyribosyltransferase